MITLAVAAPPGPPADGAAFLDRLEPGWLEAAYAGDASRLAAVTADHPRTISVREDALLEVIRQFFAQRVFGPDRATLLAADLPASAADDAARRDRQAAALTKRLRQIDTAENAHAREIETLASHDPTDPAVTALRSRILARFTELETERADINTQLADLAKTDPSPGDPALPDALPLLGDLLADAPARLQQQLYDAFDLQALYKKNMHQVTIHVTITDSTTPLPSSSGPGEHDLGLGSPAVPVWLIAPPRRRRHHQQRRRQPRLHHRRPWRTGPVFGFGTSPIAVSICPDHEKGGRWGRGDPGLSLDRRSNALLLSRW